MADNSTPRIQLARLAGLAKHVRYPMARLEIDYVAVSAEGVEIPGLHTLKLALTGDEARQLAKHISQLAQEIDAMGGSKQ